jgi:hypothetical protein
MPLIHVNQCTLKRGRGFIKHSLWTIFAALVSVYGLTGCGDVSTAPAPDPGPGPLAIVTDSPLPSGTVNQPYATTVGGSGGTTPYSWNGATGAIIGTPTALATTTPIFQLQDSSSPAEVVQKALAISILTTPQTLSITTASLPSGVVNQPYPNTTLRATGGIQPYTWLITPALPNGLQFNVVSPGTISGTPLAGSGGTTNHTFTVLDSTVPFKQSNNRQLSMTIRATVPPLTIAFPASNVLPEARVGQLYDQTLRASGGTLPYTWSVSPALPAWLQLDPSTGSLSGTPPVATNFSRTYTVRDSTLPTNLTVSRSISLRIRN